MRPDQLERLKELSERLMDVFLDEADPQLWPGAGEDPTAMDAKTRGDRYWTKKNAVATVALVQRVDALSQPTEVPSRPSDDAEQDADLDRQVVAAENEAARILKKAQRTSRERGTDKRVHGKA